jgi:O-antigen/teichoic acid export membrane protein
MPEVAAALTGAAQPPQRGWLRALALAASRGAGVLAQVGVQIAVGALGGAAALGVLQLLTSWTGLLGEALGIGHPMRAMRDAAVLGAAGRDAELRRSLRRAAMRIATLGVALAALITVAALVLYGSDNGARTGLIVAIAIATPLFALARLWAEALKGLRWALVAVTVENLTVPLALLGLAAALALSGQALDIRGLLVTAVLGFAATAILLASALRSALTAPRVRDGDGARPPTARSEQLHFWLSGLLNIAFLQLPFLLLPLFATAADIGRYAVAHKLLNVITTLLILQAAVFGPRFARAAASRSAAGLAALLARTQLLSAAIFIPCAAVLLLLAEPLAAVFSLPAGSLLPLLLLLSSGQVVNAVTGLSGVLLTMSGRADGEVRLQLAATLLTTAAAFALAPGYGVLGVAAAASAGIAGKNIASYLLARRHIQTLSGETS